MSKAIEKMNQFIKEIGTKTGKYFVMGYLAGKAVEYSGNSKKSYALSFGTSSAVAGAFVSCAFKALKSLKRIKKK